MSAKHSKKSAKPSPAAPSAGHPASANLTPAPASASGGAGAAATEPSPTFTPWIDSTDPRKRTLGKIVLIAVWLYVAALWLLALDQTFGWGIFGPKVPPVP